MSLKKEHHSRRSFIKKASIASAAVSTSPLILSASQGSHLYLKTPKYRGNFTANDQINIGLIGAGIQGIYDTRAALSVSGVKIVAACDLYQGRLARAKELWGDSIFTTRDYRKLLERQDIDAVIVATPDHWHKKITIAALKAGKHVYCEKPMVQKWEDGQAIINAQKNSGKICQVGSQGMASLNNEKARQLYQEGAIGELVLLDFYNDRYSAEGAWQYPIPPDHNPETVDFDTFLGDAPKVSYDPMRFFRWRNYKDYGTGVAGDLFVHAFSTLHYILDSNGPVGAYATGGLRYWNDGRDVPDVSITLYDFPKTATHAAFNASFRINFIAGSGGGSGFKLVGTEGEMELGWNSVTVRRSKLEMNPSSYSMVAYTEATQNKIKEGFSEGTSQARTAALNTGATTWEAPKDYKGSHHDHFYNFFTAIRENGKVIQDPTFGLRAAGAALLANESYYQKKPVKWDPQAMRLL